MNYDYGNKRHYRKTLYSTIAKDSKHDLFYLESQQALETMYLIETRRWPCRLLHPCNSNPAIAAHITRRCKRKGHEIKAIGKDIFGLGNLIKNCVMASINLDFTGPISIEMGEKISQMNLPPSVNLAVTVLRGREQKDIKDFLGYLDDDARVSFIEAALPKTHFLEEKVVGLYKSTAGNMTMLYCIFSMVEKGLFENACANSTEESIARFQLLKNEFEFWLKKGRVAKAKKIMKKMEFERDLCESIGGIFDHVSADDKPFSTVIQNGAFFAGALNRQPTKKLGSAKRYADQCRGRSR